MLGRGERREVVGDKVDEEVRPWLGFGREDKTFN
jgi:hypothetical protein